MSEPEYGTKKRSRFFSFLRAVILLLIFSIIGAVAYMCRDMITTDNLQRLFAIVEMDSTQALPAYADIYYDSSPISQFFTYRGYLVMANENGLYLFDRQGGEKLHLNLSTSNPHIDVGDKYIIAYERGGTTLTVSNSIAAVFTKKYENPLLLAKAGDGGFLAAAVNEPRYAAVVTVYNSQFEEVFKNWIPEERPLLDMAISPDNSTIAIVTLENNNGELSSLLEVFNLTSEDPVLTQKFDGSLVISAAYINRDCISLVADDKAVAVDISKSETYEYKYGNYTLQTYSQDLANATALVLSRRSLTTDCVLLVLDSRCNAVTELSLKEQVKSVSALGDKICVLDSKAKVYSLKGELVKEYDAGKDAVCSLMLDAGNIAIVGKSYASVKPIS